MQLKSGMEWNIQLLQCHIQVSVAATVILVASARQAWPRPFLARFLRSRVWRARLGLAVIPCSIPFRIRTTPLKSDLKGRDVRGHGGRVV